MADAIENLIKDEITVDSIQSVEVQLSVERKKRDKERKQIKDKDRNRQHEIQKDRSRQTEIDKDRKGLISSDKEKEKEKQKDQMSTNSKILRKKLRDKRDTTGTTVKSNNDGDHDQIREHKDSKQHRKIHTMSERRQGDRKLEDNVPGKEQSNHDPIDQREKRSKRQ